MKALGLAISKVGVWNNVQAAGMLAMAKHQGSKKKQLAVLGVDETQFKVKGRGIELAFITDPATGMVVGMELLASREGEELAKLLCEYARRHGAEVVVTDDLASYKPAAESAGVEHQVCLTHVRKAVTNRLKKISGFEVEKEAIRAAIRELTPQAKKDLKRIHLAFVRASPPKKGEQQSPAYMLRMLSLELLENWQRLTCYQRQHKGLDKLGRPIRRDYSVPSTNNATENAIGRAGKIRYRRTRGFKSVPSAMASLAVLASLGGVLCGVSYNHLFS
jgi:transposase-like protein